MKGFRGRIKGFTLIETVLTIIVVGIIAGVSAKILLSGLDTYAFVTNRKDATQHARVAMERMTNEISLLRWNDITLMSNSTLGYTDKDGVASSFRAGTLRGQPVLLRTNDFLAGQLGFVDFDYLKADGTDALLNTQVKRINVELSLDSLGGYGSITLRTEVFPRNMMYKEFR